MKKSYFLVEIESEYEIDAETLQSNIYYRFPTSVESVKVTAAQQSTHRTDTPEPVCTCKVTAESYKNCDAHGNRRRTPRELDFCPTCDNTGYCRVSPTILAKCSCEHGQSQ